MGEVSFRLNGKDVKWKGDLTSHLLVALREDFGLTGVKCGCMEGECGACSVIMDGKLVNSCMVAMGAADGSEIMTIEGYRETERFKAIDKAFAAFSAVQCGFCTPGMVLAAEALLSNNPNPSEEDVRIGLSGNLCRCTGYNSIVKAVLTATKEGKGLW